jgi:hypothetical protein
VRRGASDGGPGVNGGAGVNGGPGVDGGAGVNGGAGVRRGTGVGGRGGQRRRTAHGNLSVISLGGRARRGRGGPAPS